MLKVSLDIDGGHTERETLCFTKTPRIRIWNVTKSKENLNTKMKHTKLDVLEINELR